MHVPLGPLYLATILKQAGYDARLARPEKIEDFTNFHDADIICISFYRENHSDEHRYLGFDQAIRM
ncbi:unnamed protein product [marine sediment metagenome]|uniref:Uncharacterized protein n=1 Tax=marine sediment metagenome TaxID=412755 RepID=X1UN22_9ZZZZ